MTRLAAHLVGTEQTTLQRRAHVHAEWQGAVTLAPEFADRYLGQQGDAWDAHQDMALAAVGAVISVIVAATVQRAKGGSESLAVDIRECEPQPTAG